MAIDKLKIKTLDVSDSEGLRKILTDIIEKQNEIIDIIWKAGLDIEGDDVGINSETGHDYQCSIGIAGHECDCWRNEKLRNKSVRVIAQMIGKK